MTDDALLEPATRAYLAERRPEPDALLARLRREAAAERIPIVHEDTGNLLALLTRATRPERVLEIGTSIGYSALCIARALPSWGQLDTVEKDLDTAARAEQNLKEAGLLGRVVTVMRGPAIQLLPRLQNRYDMVFMDADKREYEAYLTLALPLMPKGGLVVVDNLLWGGRIAGGDRAGDSERRRECTRALAAFNERFLGHAELEAQVLPVGDGVGVGVKV